MENIESVTFEKLPLRDIYGDWKKELSGSFNADQLGNHLVSEWVAYIECHHCPRSETCKYTKPHPKWDWKKQEIQCGVKSEVIKNFIKLSFPYLVKGDMMVKKHLLSAAYYLADFALTAETQVGILIDPDWLKWLGNYAPSFFGQVVHLREILNKAAQDLSHVPGIYDRKPILLVEGQSEKVFLEKLRESHLAWFTDLRIEVYGGNGNRHPKRIQMRLDKYVEDGYVCFMEGDADGKQKDVFDKLLKQGTVKKENVFQFAHDFETSIPPYILLKALNNLGHLEKIDNNEFEQIIDCSQSSCKLIKEKYGLDIDPLKIELADELGWMFNKSNFSWYGDESKVMEETELGRFLDFVIKMH